MSKWVCCFFFLPGQTHTTRFFKRGTDFTVMNDSNLVTNPDCTPPGRLCDVCAWKRPIYISKMCVRVMQYETRKTASLLLTGKWKVFFLHPVKREVEVSYWTVLPTYPFSNKMFYEILHISQNESWKRNTYLALQLLRCDLVCGTPLPNPAATERFESKALLIYKWDL